MLCRHGDRRGRAEGNSAVSLRALKPLPGMRLVLPVSIKDTKTLGFTERKEGAKTHSTGQWGGLWVRIQALHL